MSSKNKPIVIDAMTIWRSQKPRYNAYQSGYGAHGKRKYTRKEKHKTDWRSHDK